MEKYTYEYKQNQNGKDYQYTTTIFIPLYKIKIPGFNLKKKTH